jgi:hypothetical protein
VRRRCEKCQAEFCYACGESMINDRTKRSEENTVLFHCSNIQGVILGIGLSMLEQCFAEVTSNATDGADEQSRKRRKMSNAEPDPPVAIMLGTGTKIYAKKHKGVGYAGDQAEDVRPFLYSPSHRPTRFPAFRSNRSSSRATSQG